MVMVLITRLASSINISQDRLLGEGSCAEIQVQIEYDDATVALCCTAAFSVWDKVEETEKRFQHFTKTIRGPKEAFTDFLQNEQVTVKEIQATQTIIFYALKAYVCCLRMHDSVCVPLL